MTVEFRFSLEPRRKQLEGGAADVFCRNTGNRATQPAVNVKSVHAKFEKASACGPSTMRISKITTLDLHVAKRLRVARLQRGISQQIAAKAVGVSFQQVQKYENGSNRVTAAKLFQLATLYDVPIQWFFAGLDARKVTLS